MWGFNIRGMGLALLLNRVPAARRTLTDGAPIPPMFLLLSVKRRDPDIHVISMVLCSRFSIIGLNLIPRT